MPRAPAYQPRTKARDVHLQKRIDDLMRGVAPPMSLRYSKSKSNRAGNNVVKAVTLDASAADQHQVAAVFVTKTNKRGVETTVIKYWDPNGVPAKGSKLYGKEYDTTLCMNRDEFFHDNEQIKKYSAADLALVTIKPDRNSWKHTRKSNRAPMGVRPKNYPALNTESPEADIAKLKDSWGACALWTYIFAVTMKRYMQPTVTGGEGLDASGAVKKWTATQKKLHKLFRIQHNWAIQLVRRDMLRGRLGHTEIQTTIHSIMMNPTDSGKWDNYELRNANITEPSEKKAYFQQEGVWDVALDVVYHTIRDKPDTIDQLVPLMSRLSVQRTPVEIRRSSRLSRSTSPFGFTRFGRPIGVDTAYKLYRQNVPFVLSTQALVV